MPSTHNKFTLLLKAWTSERTHPQSVQSLLFTFSCSSTMREDELSFNAVMC